MSDALEHADVETSSPAYARRFAGPVGAWMLDVQTRHTLDLVAPWPAGSVLDIGGGHGQSVASLVSAGYDVTVFGSQEVCRERVRAWIDAGQIRFECGDLLRLPFADQSFDVCLSYRLLAHVVRFGDLVAELSRVARHAVVVDYPTSRSVNALAEPFFGLKKGVEGDTRPFTVFADAHVLDTFAANGFTATARRPQFVWPLALHRGLSRAGLSKSLEKIAASLGLVPWLGSPVILRLERG